MKFTKKQFVRVFAAIVLISALVVPATVSLAASSPAAKSRGVSISAPLSGTSLQPLSTTYVYITNTGRKYHRYSCRYLRYSRHKVTLRYAKSHGYGACLVCRPPR